MAARKRKVPGPIVPLSAYEQLGYECIRCNASFVSPKGPEPFCKDCSNHLADPSGGAK